MDKKEVEKTVEENCRIYQISGGYYRAAMFFKGRLLDAIGASKEAAMYRLCAVVFWELPC